MRKNRFALLATRVDLKLDHRVNRAVLVIIRCLTVFPKIVRKFLGWEGIVHPFGMLGAAFIEGCPKGNGDEE